MSTQVEALLANTVWLRRLARTLVADEHTAEDLVQEACCAELAREATRPRELRAWLAGVVRKLAQRHHRERGARTRREARAARPECVPPASHFLEEAELQQRLLAAVLALEEPYRSTIVARFLEGASAEEIARREGVPGSTVRTRIQRALARLRQALDREFDGREAWALVALRAPRGGSGHMAQRSPASPRSVVRAAVAAGAFVALGAVTWRVLTPSVPVEEAISPAPAASERVADAAGALASVTRPTDALVDTAAPVFERVARTASDSGTDIRSPLAVAWQLTGRITDPEGAPVPDAAVRWRDKYNVWHRQNETHTDGDGRYTFAFESQEIALDVRDLGVLHPRFQSRLASFVLTEDSFTDGAATVDVQLERGARAMFQCTDEQGHPLPQVRLRLTASYDALEGTLPYRVEDWPWRDWSALFRGGKVSSGWTDSAGLCTLDGVAPGAARLLVWSQGFLEKDFAIPPDSSELHTVVLERGPIARGVLVDADGAPVAGAEVYLDSGGARQWTTSGPDGSFASGGLGGAHALVSVVHPGFAPFFSARWIDLGRGDVRITLDRGRTIELGLVDDATGLALAGTAKLDLTDDHGTNAFREAMPELSVELVSGELRVEKLGRFLAALWIRVEGYDPLRVSLVAPEAATGEVMRLVPARSFEIELVDAASGAPVLDGVVRVGQEMADPQPGTSRMTGTQLDASNTPTFIHANHFTIPSEWLGWNERVSLEAWAYGYAPLALETTKTELRASTGLLRIALTPR